MLAAVLPVTRIDSPSAIITNSEQRSARCSPSIVQWRVSERPRPGTQKPIQTAPYSTAIAIDQSSRRSSCSARAPAIQSSAETENQTVTRRKLRVSCGWALPSAQSRNSVRPICIAT